MENCLFCKIIEGKIPAKKMHEDEDMLIFCDIDPKAKNHYLMVLKQHFPNLSEMSEKQSLLLGRCLKKIPTIEGLNLQNGYRLVINQGEDACQTVPHVHVHILSGQKMGWNPA